MASKERRPGIGTNGPSVDGVEEAPETPTSFMKGVSWQDIHHGQDLTSVREFEPSEVSDSDEDEYGRPRSRGKPQGGCCVIQ